MKNTDLLQVPAEKRPLVVAQLVEKNPASGIKALQAFADTQGDIATAALLRELRSIDRAAMSLTQDLTTGSLVAALIESERVPALLLDLIRMNKGGELPVMASLLYEQTAERQKRIIDAILDQTWGGVFFTYLLLYEYGQSVLVKGYEDWREAELNEWSIVLRSCLENERFVKEAQYLLLREVEEASELVDRGTVVGDALLQRQALVKRELKTFITPDQKKPVQDSDLMKPL